MEKHGVSRLSYLFAHLHLLCSDSFSSTLLSSNLSLLSASALLCFSSVHIVGSLTSKLPSMSLSVVMMKFPIYGKIKNVPNHQPEKRTPKPLKKRQIPIWIRHCWYIAHSKLSRITVKKTRLCSIHQSDPAIHCACLHVSWLKICPKFSCVLESPEVFPSFLGLSGPLSIKAG